MYDIMCSVVYVCCIYRCAISTRTGACMLYICMCTLFTVFVSVQCIQHCPCVWHPCVVVLYVCTCAVRMKLSYMHTLICDWSVSTAKCTYVCTAVLTSLYC